MLAGAIVLLTSLWILLGAHAVLRITRRSTDDRQPTDDAPAARPVSVLKPLCGRDASLEANLQSFFLQDLHGIELVFGVERADDPAVPVVRALMATHPRVAAKLVIQNATRGQNPKVRNLLGMLPHASHDLVLISDSNVHAPPHYVRELVQLKRAGVGLVTNLFAGEGQGSLAAKLECVELAGFVAAGSALPTSLGDAAVIGKSMLFSRTELEPLGGIGRLADVLAEDYVLGKMVQQAGLAVVVAPTVLTNVVGPISLRAVFDRHLRWSMLRFRLRPSAFLLEPLTMPLLVLPIAWLAFGPWALTWAFAMWVARDLGGWWLLRGARSLHVPLLLGPVRDLMSLCVWAVTPLKRHVSWRGHRVRVGAGTLLFATR